MQTPPSLMLAEGKVSVLKLILNMYCILKSGL